MLFLIYIKNCKKTILFYHYGHRYFSRMHKEKDSGRALGLDPFFRDRLCFFVFFYFLLPFYLRILILYTTDFNPRINKDITIIITIIIVVYKFYLTVQRFHAKVQSSTCTTHRKYLVESIMGILLPVNFNQWRRSTNFGCKVSFV